MAKKGVIMYYDLLEQLEDFSDEDFGKITRAMIEYDKTGTLPNFEGQLKVAFKFIKLTIDRNKADYEQKCEKNRENINKRWNKINTTEYDGIESNTNHTDIDKDKDINKDNDIKEKILKKESECVDVFNYWNSKNIVSHRELTEDKKKAIEKSLKLYSVDEIKTYIDRYNTILKDSKSPFNYQWSLVDFLNRKNGISSFTDEGSKWVSYCNSNKIQNTNTITHKITTTDRFSDPEWN